MSLPDSLRPWFEADPDAETRAELMALAESDPDEVARRFAGHLRFGTAGLRGPLGTGPDHMNRVIVRRAAGGLMAWLRERGEKPTVVIGCDARHKSDLFAADTASVVERAGGEAIRLPEQLPTPVLAFAVRHLHCDAGVMVTASHNPPGDNGYKVYLADGAQLVPPADAEIESAIAATPLLPRDLAAPMAKPGSRAIVEAYLDQIIGGSGPDLGAIRVAYTPLHGVGRDVVVAALDRRGLQPAVVANQADPDGDFPTLAFPNPEEAGTLDAVLALAREIDADVVVANDPDADRLAVAVPGARRSDPWRVLTGDELGWLLADHRLATTEGSDRLVVTTIVSSSLLQKMAVAAGVRFAETLTGFKWIVRPGLTDPTARFVFGYEEALGYAVNDVVRDKDGISAAVALLEAVARLGGSGRDLARRLGELAAVHGRHRTGQVSVRVEGAPAMARLRAHVPSTIAGMAVIGLTDYVAGSASLPPTDGIRFDLAGGARVVVRPSGTEPKVKVYLEVIGDPADEAGTTARLDALRAAAPALLGATDYYGGPFEQSHVSPVRGK